MNPQVLMGRGGKGAVGELLAAAQLMVEGYYVYRCESPHAPFDLIAYRDGSLVRVEVKTLTQDVSKRWGPSFSTPKTNEWDLLCVVDVETGSLFSFKPEKQISEARAEIRRAYGFYNEAGLQLSTCGAMVIYLDRHEATCPKCTEISA